MWKVAVVLVILEGLQVVLPAVVKEVKVKQNNSDLASATNASWHVSNWFKCSAQCGDGVQHRLVFCSEQRNDSAITHAVDEHLCDASHQPESKRPCSNKPCPLWQMSDWSKCTALCGEGVSYRKIACRASDGTKMAEQLCGEKPETKKLCVSKPCTGAEWIVSPWSQCKGSCQNAVQVRLAFCADAQGSLLLPSLCDSDRLPEVQRSCERSCDQNVGVWFASEWSECSSSCGDGVRTRHATCLDATTHKQLAAGNCGPMPDEFKVRVETCRQKDCTQPTWYTSDWSPCKWSDLTQSLAKTREKFCLLPNGKTSQNCDIDMEPDSVEVCPDAHQNNGRLRAACSTSVYGCCPDGVAAAKGANSKGCAQSDMIGSCVGSEYGCCLDGRTAALGPFFLGCSDIYTCKDTEFGCCKDGISPAGGSNQEFCSDHAECFLSDFGCCDDGVTSASGPNQAGCDVMTVVPEGSGEMGCEQSEFGCCEDGVTTATGEDYQGCSVRSEVTTCSDTQYGCCDDGITVAKGKGKDDCPEVNICSLPPITGPCKAALSKYFYDSERGVCVEFIFGGCDGNKNRFESEEDCQNACGSSVTVDPTDAVSVEAGNDIHLTCQIPRQSHVLTWSYIGEDMAVISLMDLPDSLSQSDRVEISEEDGQSVLFIKNLQTDDTGGYVCSVFLNETGESLSTNVTIHVFESRSTGSDHPDYNSDLLSTTEDYATVITQETERTTTGSDRSTTTQLRTTMMPLLATNASRYSTNHLPIILSSTSSATSTLALDATSTLGSTHNYATLTSVTSVKALVTTEAENELIESAFTYEPHNVTGALTDCAHISYGCCLDGSTPSKGPNLEGCPSTDESLSQYPKDVRIIKYAEPSNSTVEVLVSWKAPVDTAQVDLYSVFYTTDTTLPLVKWNTAEVTEPYLYLTVPKQGSTFFKVRAYNRMSKSPVSPTHSFDLAQGDTSRQLRGGCYGTRHGCCDDGLTPAADINRAGCPEQDVVTMVVSTDLPETVSTVAAQTYTSSRIPLITTTLKGLPPAPKNFLIMRDAVASDRVSVWLKWEKPSSEYPANEYAVRFSSDILTAVDLWRRFTVNETKYHMALRRKTNYYFTVAGVVNGVDSQMSPILIYNSEEQMSKVYRSSCMESLYGCCPDDMTAADGPQQAGCPAPDCKISRYGCCADGVTTASGQNGEGCPMVMVTTPISCSSSSWGCCSDGVSYAEGPDQQGCIDQSLSCDISSFGCCPNGQTPARGANFEGCSIPQEMQSLVSCSLSLYGCCPDGVTKAQSVSGAGCPDMFAKAAACALPSETGSCSNYTINWYFDVDSGSCRRFWFGGCEGNGNRFSSKKDCEAVCVEPDSTAACHLPPVAGRCLSQVQKWHYDPKSASCREFIYGGCAGNNNKFDTEADCQRFCRAPLKPDVCSLAPKVAGPCRGSFERWSYSHRSGQCETFVYGGCRGNENRFTNFEECNNACVERDPKDVCTLPKENGQCHALVPSWFFDVSIGSCQQFFYGGCGGNLNRFNTQRDCKERCDHVAKSSRQETCQAPADPGECQQSIPQFAFDMNRGTCTQFTYGGCGGNKNRFDSHEECIKACSSVMTPKFTADDCLLPTESGACSDSLQHFSYDPLDGQCKPFLYSGCPGNNNNFKTQGSCEQTCAPTYEDAQSVCTLPETTGPCTGRYSRWRYDASLGQCIPFHYGGCLGNRNNFLDEQSCLQRCGAQLRFPEDICLLPKESGPCGSSMELFFFNANSGKCEAFNYGGCSGNANRFQSMEECAGMCATRPSEDPCKLNKDIGPCKASLPRWFYNSQTLSCEKFVFGGCRGNTNNFQSLEDCQARCAKSTSDTRKDECLLPAYSGPCLANMLRWHFDPISRVCKTFVYGGCSGNANRFMSEEDCYNHCGDVAPATWSVTEQMETVPLAEAERCKGKGEYGLCQGHQISYYFDSEQSICKEFIFSGCGGNSNRFDSLVDCRSTCMSDKIAGCVDQMCSTPCPYGYITDAFGCSTCKCLNVCSGVSCPLGSICVERRIHCEEFDLSCKPTMPICVTGSEKESSCAQTTYGCCLDGITAAKDSRLSGCPEVAPYISRPAGVGSQFVRVSGSTVTLPCVAYGAPQPSISWYKDRLPIEAVDRLSVDADGSLTVENIQSSDGGEYICRADNSVGDPAYEYLTLTVQEGVLIHEGPTEFITRRGDTLVLPCPVTGYPKPEVKWLFVGEKIAPGSKFSFDGNHSLIIQDVEQNDEGDYVCVASNEINSASKTLSIVIQEPLNVTLSIDNPIYMSGDLLNISCVVQGFPPAKTEWLQNNEIVPYDDRVSINGITLQINNITERDSGYYTCIASNKFETKRSMTSVLVKPRDSPLPASCQDQPNFANCRLIVNHNFCNHRFYKKFCCASCVKAGKISLY